MYFKVGIPIPKVYFFGEKLGGDLGAFFIMQRIEGEKSVIIYFKWRSFFYRRL